MLSIQKKSALIRFIQSAINAKSNARSWLGSNGYRWNLASDEGFFNRLNLQCQQWKDQSILIYESTTKFLCA
jgi:hypothetical protein|tara:strand:+ start:437 stop:652 length:216 start_codon:yes stop_codon:yes gene_type:complete